jgi:hypothetical protein
MYLGYVIPSVGWFGCLSSFAVKGFWALRDNVYECLCRYKCFNGVVIIAVERFSILLYYIVRVTMVILLKEAFDFYMLCGNNALK